MFLPTDSVEEPNNKTTIFFYFFSSLQPCSAFLT